MDNVEAIDGRSLYVSNEYPDLDLVPSYLWVGRAGDHLHHSTSISSDGSSRQPRESFRDSVTEQNPEKKQYARASDMIASEDNQGNFTCQSSGDIDPDFESHEDSSTQVFSCSRTVACY